MPLINSNLVSPASCNSTYRLRYWNLSERWPVAQITIAVATVLTVYGIETLHWCQPPEEHTYKLQQYLPFTVLKRHAISGTKPLMVMIVATVLTVYGIETHSRQQQLLTSFCCNSTYRLRYWNWIISKKFIESFKSCNSTYRLRYWNKSKSIHAYCFLRVEVALTTSKA